MNNIKKVITFIIFIIFIFFILITFRNNLSSYIPSKIKTEIKKLILSDSRLKSLELADKHFAVLKEIDSLDKHKNDNHMIKHYNELNFPQTQLVKLSYKELSLENIIKADKITTNYNNNQINLKPKKVSTFFLESFTDDIIVATKTGNFFFFNNKLISNLNDFNLTTLNSNFDNKNNKILDILVVNDSLVISYSKKISDNCFIFNIAKAKFNKKFLNFRNFFVSQECSPESFFAGKLHEYFHENEKGLLVTIDMWGVTEPKENIRNSGNSLPQDQNSLFGKILFLNYKGEYKVFSKGHRTPQGLFVTKENFILSTEHGPRGGDEINLIEYKGNYGWPVASYGELYKNQEPLNKLYYKKSHEQYGFIDPIFSFSQSIGISQLTEVPKNFSKYWNNNFLITSLNSASLYRVKFDNNFTKLLYYEKIFVGKRIRDIIYIESLKTFIISLDEGSGFLGFVSLDE